ncbi:hypothetical protein B0H10DRAFT_2221036 [Mycena sp. CBHHK59/15]|nr:hypothetical protein B0H10DRAFT_2221036 [Mycena sp. CBHHK59/15]
MSCPTPRMPTHRAAESASGWFRVVQSVTPRTCQIPPRTGHDEDLGKLVKIVPPSEDTYVFQGNWPESLCTPKSE